MRCFVDPPAIFLYKDAIDFRKSINGLIVVIEQELERSAFEPALYVFCNRARDKLKILYWDNTGFALWYKRLEKARQMANNNSGGNTHTERATTAMVAGWLRCSWASADILSASQLIILLGYQWS